MINVLYAPVHARAFRGVLSHNVKRKQWNGRVKCKRWFSKQRFIYLFFHLHFRLQLRVLYLRA